MLRSTSSLTAAIGKFLEALEKYQRASVNINQAAQKMCSLNLALCREVDVVARAAAPAVISRRDR